MGLSSRVAGRQTLVYTSPFEHMKPTLRGAKVNGAGPAVDPISLYDCSGGAKKPDRSP